MVRWIETHAPSFNKKEALKKKLYNLSRLLILSSANDYCRDKVLFKDFNETARAIEMAFNIYQESIIVGGVDDLDKMMQRTAYIQFIEKNKHDIISRGYLLFCKIPQTTNLSYNLETEMNDEYNISPFEFLKTGYFLADINNGKVYRTFIW